MFEQTYFVVHFILYKKYIYLFEPSKRAKTV